MSYSLSATVNRLDTSALARAVANQGPQDDATAIGAAVGAVEAFLTSGAWGNDSASVSVSGGETYLSLSLTRLTAPAETAQPPAEQPSSSPGTPAAAPDTSTPAPQNVPATLPTSTTAEPAPAGDVGTPATSEPATGTAPAGDTATSGY